MGKELTPTLRFRGFEGDWQTETFNDVFTLLQNNTLSRAALNNEVGLAFDVHYGDVLIKFGEVLDVQNARLPYIVNEEDVQKTIQSVLRDGDVIFADTAEDYTAGKSSEIQGVDGKTILSGLHTIPCRPKIEFAPFYLGYYTNSESFREQLYPLMQGIKVISISKKFLKSVDCSFPFDLQEQKFLGLFFQKISNLILNLEQRHAKLLNFKKSMLQKMFPQNGSAVPEVRFAGFREPWKKYKLERLVDVKNGEDYKHLSSGSIPVFGTGGYITSVNKALSYNNAIGIGRKGTIDKPFILTAPFWTVDTLFYAVPRKCVNLNFTYALFQEINWKQKDESTTVPSLSKTIINNILVRLPEEREQTLIGNFLIRLDHLAESCEKKIVMLQILKKTFLSRMFV